MNLDDKSCFDSIRELMRSPGLVSKLDNDALALLEADYDDVDSLLTSTLSTFSPFLLTCVGRASRRSLILNTVISWKEASQRLLLFLIENGYLPGTCDCQCADGHESPLSVACHVGNLPAISALMPARLDGDTGMTLARAAVAAGQLSVMQLLTETGEIDLKSDVGLELLTMAVRDKRLAIARFLLRRGAPLSGSLVTQHSVFVGQLLRTMTDSVDDADAVASLKSVKLDVALLWKALSLAEIQGDWLTDDTMTITELDVSKNQLSSLPSAVFTHMKSLRTLDASHNSLAGLGNDSTIMQSTSLKILNLSANHLTHVSKVLFTLPNLNTLKVSHNHLRSLPIGDASNNWSLSVLKHLDVSHNKLNGLPLSFKQLQYLKTLDVSYNELKELPGNWSSSLLEVLNASHNQLTQFPLGAEVMLAQSLKDLNLSHNQLVEIAWSIPQLARLMVLNLSHNRITELPLPNWWACRQLEELNLSNNLLGSDELDDLVVIESLSPSSDRKARQRIRQSSDIGREDSERPQKAKVEFPVDLFKHCLKRLKLDNNCLARVPDSVCGLTALTQLSLSNNYCISSLPNELGNLANCWLMELQGLDLENVPDHVRPGVGQGSTKRLLAYLRAQLRQSVLYTRVKLMVVGLQKRGKTSLLKRLRGQPLPTVDISTVGVDVAEWELPGSSGGGKGRKSVNKPTIVLSTWDLAGQDVYYATHQCFLSSNALYLAVFSLENGEAGVAELKLWLLNIQARAPDSFVIIVATHKDKMKGPNASKRVDELLKLVSDRYCIRGYPNIIAIRAISNVTSEGLQELQNDIQVAVTKIQDQDTKMPLIERLIPASYLTLQKSVSNEAQRRRLTNEHGVIEQSEFLKMAEKSEDNDIHDEEELHLAAKFLHEAGILLHYNDQLRRLSNLYFIDPSWLIGLLAEFVTVRERHSFIQNGFLARRNVPFILRGKRYPEQYVDQYLQMLEHFEIALSIDSEQMLVPSMLPVNKPEVPGVCSPSNYLLDQMTFSEKEASSSNVDPLRNDTNDSAVHQDEALLVQPKKQGAIQKFGNFLTKFPLVSFSPPALMKRRSKELKNPYSSATKQHVSNQLHDDRNASPGPVVAMKMKSMEDESNSIVTELMSASAALLATLGSEDDDNQGDDSDDDILDKKADTVDIELGYNEPTLVDFSKDVRLRTETIVSPEFSTHRYYKMVYIPSGFWSRLIVRLVVNLERAGFGRPFSIGNSKPKQDLLPLDLDDDNDSEEWIKTKKQVFRSSVVLWRTGVVVVHRGGHFVVEALQHVPRVRELIARHIGQAGIDPTQLDGINIEVHSRGVKDFSAMGYIVDQVDGLIEDWFPGLTEVDLFGEPLVCHFIPWKNSDAAALSHTDESLSLDCNTHLLKLTDCAKAVAIGNTIHSPVGDVDIPLSDLVPDLMLADIPPSMHINKMHFDFKATSDTQLGAGGAGEVYIGKYHGKAVAIKQFTGTQLAHDSSQSNLEPGSIMAQLRGEETIALLRELRQEAVVLSHLKHPCVVSLVGVSLSFLCLVMELAPKKSLNAILDEKVIEKRKEVSNFHRGSMVMSNKINGVVLGNKLTYRIVYQIASALAYLHSRTIIYRDLKPDNVLVWSLSLDDTINIKLSDYGISRFASPSGLKGEELGTPGFMAPEAMRKKGNDSAFDEKVDIFSFGMVLFQLLCGVRPYSHYKEQEINRAVYSGERPNLKKYTSVTSFPKLEQLMYACWQVVSYERPSASAIISEMKDPSFSCLQHQLPKPQDEALHKVDCVYVKPMPIIERLSSERERKRGAQTPTIDLPWILSHSDDRLLSVLNTKLGIFKIKQVPLKRRKVTCITYVDGCMWMGTEVNCSIQVVGQLLVGMPQCIWSLKVPAPVLALTTIIDHSTSEANQEVVVDRVIAALADGCLCLFTRLLSWTELHVETKAGLEYGKDSWELKKTLEVSPNTPLHSTVLIRDQTELWCTAYNHLFAIDLNKFEVVHSAEMFMYPKSFITWLVADEHSVYGIDKRAPFVLQWDIASRRLCWILDCSRISLEVQTNVCLTPHEDIYLETMNRCIRVTELAQTTKARGLGHTISVQPDQGQRVSQWKSMKSSRSLDSQHPTQSSESFASTSSRVDRHHSSKNLVLRVEAAMPRLPQRITSLLIVKDTLWVARGMGDIIILKRDITSSGVCPVVGVLRAEENPAQYGNSSDQKLTLVDNEQVVASQYLEQRNLQDGEPKQLIVVYSAWGSSEFEKLSSFQHQLNKAERRCFQDK